MKSVQIPHEIELVRQFDPCLRVSCVSPDGQWCLFQDEALPKVTMWRIDEGAVYRSFQIEKDCSIMGGTEKFRTVSFSPDGRFVIAGGHGGRVCIWDQSMGGLIESVIDRVHANLGYVMSAAIDRSNKTLLVGAMYGAFVFKLFPAELILHFTKHSGQVNSIAFSPDQKHAISASADERVRIWDFLSGHQVRIFHQADLDGTDPGGNFANVVTVSRDGTAVLSGGSSKLLWLWNSRKPDDPVFVLRGHESDIWNTQISSDGYWGVSGSRSEAILWNLRDGSQVMSLENSTYPVILPDEEHLIANTPDGPRLWKLHFKANTQNLLFKP
jgi:WD40 repeat protein